MLTLLFWCPQPTPWSLDPSYGPCNQGHISACEPAPFLVEGSAGLGFYPLERIPWENYSPKSAFESRSPVPATWDGKCVKRITWMTCGPMCKNVCARSECAWLSRISASCVGGWVGTSEHVCKWPKQHWPCQGLSVGNPGSRWLVQFRCSCTGAMDVWGDKQRGGRSPGAQLLPQRTHRPGPLQRLLGSMPSSELERSLWGIKSAEKLSQRGFWEQNMQLWDLGKIVPISGCIPISGWTSSALPSTPSFCPSQSYHLATDCAHGMALEGLQKWNPPQLLALFLCLSPGAFIFTNTPLSTFFFFLNILIFLWGRGLLNEITFK